MVRCSNCSYVKESHPVRLANDETCRNFQHPESEKKVTYISIAPTWGSIMPYLIHLIRHGSAENQKFAEGELTKLAHNYDEASRIYREEQEKKG